MQSDKELIQRYQKGDDQAFEELVRFHIKALYNFIYTYVGNRRDADDATQETFIKAWKEFHSFDQNKNFRTWLFAIGHNTAIDLLRKKKIYVFSDFEMPDTEESFADSIAGESLSPEALLIQKEENHELAAAVASLKSDYQTVLNLHYHENRTFEEIGRMLKRPLNTVKSWHRRALALLNKEILG